MGRHELTEEQWLVLEPMLERRLGRPPKITARSFLNAVLWRSHTGIPWRDLPAKFGRYKTIYSRFRRWAQTGHFNAIFEALQADADSYWHSIDGSYVRAHQHSAGGTGGDAVNAIGISRGGRTTKLHARVDSEGRPLQIELTPGNIHDCSVANELLDKITADAIIADKAYDTDAIVNRIEASGASAVIPPKRNRKRQRRYSKSLYRERNVVERFFCRLKHWRGIATRYEKTLSSYRAVVILACAIIWIR